MSRAAEKPDPTSVGIVAVGDELLAGAHPDLNSPFLASRCVESGRRVRRIIVVRDFEDEIADAVNDLARDCATAQAEESSGVHGHDPGGDSEAA